MKYYNKRFSYLKNRILATLLPIGELLISFYIKGFPTTISMWVKRADKTTLQFSFVEAFLVEKEMYGLKDIPDQELAWPSTSRRKQEHIPKPTTLDKYPYEMDNMNKLLQRIYNDMVNLKRENGDNQGNNRGQVRPPLRRPYQLPLNQPPPNRGEKLTSDEFYSIFKALTSTSPNVQNNVRQEIVETMPPNDDHDPFINTINCFLELPMVK